MTGPGKHSDPNDPHSGDMPVPNAIEALLPWHAAGTLSPGEARRVEEALARDPALAAHFERVLEEREASIISAEALGMPSSRAADRLFAAIEAEPARHAPGGNPLTAGLRWIGDRLAGLGPGRLGLIAGAAALALVLQGGALTRLLVESGGGFETASSGSATDGAFLLVAFQPEARAGQIGSLLQQVQGRIVDGPYPGGIFKVRVGDIGMAEDARQDVLGRLQHETAIIRMAAPAR